MIFQYDEVAFYYDVMGEGNALLLLHGNGEDHSYFDDLVPLLVQHGYQCILMDMRGHGKSTFGKRELNFILFANDVKALLEYLGICKINMLGFSDGANTVLQIALLYPNIVNTMILNGGNLYFKAMTWRCQVSILCEYYAMCLTEKVFLSLQHKRKIINLMVNYPNIQPKQLQSIQLPTLVIVGEKDMITKKHSLLITNSIKDAKFIEIARGNHFVAKEKPMIVYNEVDKFLQEAQYGR